MKGKPISAEGRCLRHISGGFAFFSPSKSEHELLKEVFSHHGQNLTPLNRGHELIRKVRAEQPALEPGCPNPADRQAPGTAAQLGSCAEPLSAEPAEGADIWADIEKSFQPLF